MDKTQTWWEMLPERMREGAVLITEEDAWQAIADANDLDFSEIADGDLMEWL